MDRDLEAIAAILGTVKTPALAEHVAAAAIYLKYERFRAAREELAVALGKQPELAPLQQAISRLDVYIANRPTWWQRVCALFGRQAQR